ncbi:hypothetical protein [Streptomyces sp. NPDC048551]|uniref:hypothetical protein n=1 Tax=Streptomyces sp. NPDC048551 TaxID=3155758 RepID=UPI00341F2DB3
MSGGQTKLAEHPVLIFIGVVATIIGALAAGKDLFGSNDPPPRAADAVPRRVWEVRRHAGVAVAELTSR